MIFWKSGLLLFSLKCIIKAYKSICLPTILSKGKDVSTCLQAFCNEKLSALKVHFDLETNDWTVKYFAKFIEFWEIVSVHTIYADTHTQDLARTLIRTPNDKNLQKLIDMSNFDKYVRCLTKDTGNPISQIFNSLVELS